jgi:adenosylhomocysteine nucleosidase
MPLLISFSTINEAKSLLGSIENKQVDAITYKCKFGYILISGMGPTATLHSLYQFPYAVDEIWNLGIAGALNSSLKSGDLYEVNQVGKLAPTEKETSIHGIYVFNQLHPHFTCETKITPSYKLISSDYPLFHENVKNAIQHEWDLVDMEGYALASFANEKKVPLKIWKGVSDLASSNGEFAIVDLLPKVSNKLAEQVILSF